MVTIHNCGQACEVGTWIQRWRDLHLIITEYTGFYGGAKGVTVGPYVLINNRDDKRQTRKKQLTLTQQIKSKNN